MLSTGAVAAAALSAAPRSAKAADTAITLPKLFAPSERESERMPTPRPPEKRVGFALVGLGRLSLDQLLPAFGATQRCRVAALVSGDADKARTVAAQYGVPATSVYDYKTFDRIRDDRGVDVVYVVLPNSLHAEYTIRAAAAGKHVLCEKPMANSVAECQSMVEACRRANKKLMVAYRMQYEPFNRDAIQRARSGVLGRLKAFVAFNTQNQGDPRQWRLKKALAGGGALPDVGIYCLNAARYLCGEEPIEVSALIHSTPNDPRFAEVEEQVDFTLRFPSGMTASCMTSYGAHSGKNYRLLGTDACLELDQAFAYHGQKMRMGRKLERSDQESVETPQIEAKNQFALEMDHFAACIEQNKRPHTPGEEGLQDMKIITALYQAGRSGSRITLPLVSTADAFRGPAPT